MKRLVFLFIVLFSFCLVSACSCSDNNKHNGPIDGYYIETTLENQTIELGDKLFIPESVVVDNKGNKTPNPQLYIFDPAGAIRSASSTTIKFSIEGEWKVVYYSDYTLDKEIIIKVVDNNAPTVSVSGLKSWVFVGETVDLPVFTLHDHSKIDYNNTYEKIFIKTNESWEEVDFNSYSRTFTPTIYGEYKFVLYVCDEKGNKGQYEYKILATENDWTIPLLKEGYLAEFNSPLYEYFIDNSMTAAGGWWNGSSDAIAYYETDVEGALNGDALKVVLQRGANGAFFTLRLPNSGRTSTEGQMLIMRIKSSHIANTFYNDDLEHTETISNVGQPDENGWSIVTVPLDYLDGNAYALEKFTFLISYAMNPTDELFYIDYVKVADKLSSPSEFSYADGVITFNAIENANGYKISFDNQEIVVNDNSYEIGDKRNYYRVKSLGDSIDYIDSDYSYVNATFPQRNSIIIDFNEALCEKLVGDNFAGGGYWYSKGNPVAKYIERDVEGAVNGDALEITVKGNQNGNAGFSISFPRPFDNQVENYDGYIYLRYKGDYEPHFINQSWELDIVYWNDPNKEYYHHGYEILEDNGWKIVQIPSWMTNGAYGLVSIDFLLTPGIEVRDSFYFDYAFVGSRINRPSAELTDGNLTWTNIEGATGYYLEIDGTVFEVENINEYQLVGQHIARVKAKAQYSFWDSEWSDYVYEIELQDGYVAEYDNSIYEYLFEKNSYGGNYWYAADISAEYVTNGVPDGAINNDAVKVVIKLNEEGTGGLDVIFPKNTEQAIYLRYYGIAKTPYTVTTINRIPDWNIAGENGIEYTVTEDESGWNKVAFSYLTNITRATFLISGEPREEITLYFDSAYISMGVLSKPTNVRIEGNNLKWDAVENADSYRLMINGTEIGGVLSNSYDFTSYLGQSYIVSVKAISEEVIYSNSEWSEEITNKLSSPKNLRVEGSVLVWDTVDGADSYEILLVDFEETYSSNINSIEGVEAGMGIIKVRAIAQESFANSDWTQIIV